MLAILLSLSACSGGGDDPVDPTPKPEISKSEITMDVTLVSNGLSFGSTEGNQTVSFTASDNWTLSVASTPSGATWCKPSATSGSKGIASVKFTVEANTGYEDRMVSVTIKSGTASKTFTVTQKGADALLVTTSKYEIPQSGGQIEVEVKSNLNYQLAVSEDAKSWITEGSGRSLTTRKHSFTISPNEEVDKREGTITFKSGDKSEVVTVYQSGGAIILLSQDEYTVSSEGDTLSVDVKSNVDYGVELPDVDWITDISSSRGMSSHTLEYVVHSNSTYDSRSSFIVFYDHNSDLKDTLTIHQQGIPFDTDYVDLKFDQPGVITSYNETDGSLSVTYPSGYLPTVTPGNSIVLPAECHFDIRVIESVSVSGNTLRMTTSQGNMTNLFRNTSFTLTTDASVTSRSAGSTVYTPTAYGYINEKGEYVEMYNESTSSRQVYPLDQNFWDFYQDFNGEKIYEGKAGTLYWDKCEFEAGLKGTFTFDFGEKEIDEVRKVGDLKKFGYQLTGNLGMDLLLHYEYEHEYSESEDEIIKKNVIPTKYIKFVVGTVPVVILVDTHLGKSTECQIVGTVDEEDDESIKMLDATTGVKLGTEVSIGLEWTPGSGVTPTRKVEPTFELYPFTIEARAHAEAKVSYYPQIVVGIYKFLGPWLETRPYLKETVDAGFYYSNEGDDNYIGWKAETYNGMDLRMGLNLDFGVWGKELWHSDPFNSIPDRLLFEAPSRIRTLSPENHIKVEKDESVTAEFMVESFSPITNEYYPCPWALINFEPESGNLNQPLAVTNLEGKATVAWTPDPGSAAQSRATETVNRKLTAKVVDGEGETIDETGLVVKIEKDKENIDEENDKKNTGAVDLGLSISWATCNLGAEKPEEYGNYFAFGEIEAKSSYSWENWNNPKTLNLSGEQDAATQQLGSGWRMPTKKECEELLQECSWKLIAIEGVKGYEVTGKNGNSIFLPLTGSYTSKEENYEARYRTSEAKLDGSGYDDPATIVMELQQDFTDTEMDSAGGWVGHPIRPVLLNIVGKWEDLCKPACYYVFEANGTGLCYDGYEVDRIKWEWTSSENELFITKTTPLGRVEEEEIEVKWINDDKIEITQKQTGYDGSQVYYRAKE